MCAFRIVLLALLMALVPAAAEASLTTFTLTGDFIYPNQDLVAYEPAAFTATFTFDPDGPATITSGATGLAIGSAYNEYDDPNASVTFTGYQEPGQLLSGVGGKYIQQIGFNTYFEFDFYRNSSVGDILYLSPGFFFNILGDQLPSQLALSGFLAQAGGFDSSGNFVNIYSGDSFTNPQVSQAAAISQDVSEPDTGGLMAAIVLAVCVARLRMRRRRMGGNARHCLLAPPA